MPSRRKTLVLVLTLAGCTDKSDLEDDWLPDLPTAACGTQSWDWVPPATLGEVVDWERVDEWSLDKGTIAGLMSLAGFSGLVEPQYDVQTWRIRYTTQDRGEVVEATAILSMPAAAIDAPMLAYFHPTTGFDDHCAPSGRDVIWAGPAIVLGSLGYATIAPDFLGQVGFGGDDGMRHPYLVTEVAAVDGLDAMRAAHAFAASGADADLVARPGWQVGLLGVSQGSFNALRVQRYAAEYLPEAEVEAVVLGVPPASLRGAMELSLETLSVSTVGFGLFLRLANDWYGAPGVVEDTLTPEALAWVDQTIAEDCPTAAIPAFATSVEAVWTPDFIAEGGVAEPWGCMLDENDLAASPPAPGPPVLYVTAADDTVAWPALQHAEVDALCAEGYAVEHVACAETDHHGIADEGLPLMTGWLLDRMRGVPWTAPDCAVSAPVDCSEG
ncbi:MAG: hypothetical protein H6739_40435 [Alphaproteobacteria bacterium]|nr:hypothetical protein [Alphaproteobacteria bacterium]